jgi:uncharacterized protein
MAFISVGDPYHEQVIQLLRAETGSRLVPGAILAEIAYMLEQRAGPWLVLSFVQDLQSGAYTLDCGEENLTRVCELMDRYQDLPLGLADAAVIACAERHGKKVLTLDGHFAVVAREGTIEVLPEPY